jgi:RNA polymerase sigma-70 factor (ECF subfamily)
MVSRGDREDATPTAGDDVPGGDERDLLLRHLRGEPGAFAELVSAYRAPVYSYLLRCGVAEGERDDLFQEIFIRIHRAAGQYLSDRPLHPWLFTIVANTVRTHVRQKKVRDLVFGDPPAQDPPDSAADGEATARARQTRAWLEQRIHELPQTQREVLILTCIQNLPQKQVASILGLRLNTVKTHLRRARLALVSQLARRESRSGGEVSS